MSYETRPQPTTDSSSKLEDRGTFVEQVDSPRSDSKPNARNLNAKLANPLSGVSHEQLMADAAIFAGTHDLAEYTETIQKGALVAQDPAAFESLPLLTEEDRVALRREITHKWDQPAMLYYLVVMCSIAAAVQGVRSWFYHDSRIYSCFLTVIPATVLRWTRPSPTAPTSSSLSSSASTPDRRALG